MKIICKGSGQSNRSCHAGQKNGNTQHDSSHRAQQITSHSMQKRSSVFKGCMRNGTDIRQHVVNTAENQHRSDSGNNRIFHYIFPFFHLKTGDGIDNNNGKYRTCRTVQGIVPFNHTFEERNILVFPCSFLNSTILYRIPGFVWKQAYQIKQGNAYNQYWRHIFSDNIHNLAWISTKIIGQQKEHGCHRQRDQPRILLRHIRANRQLIRYASCSRQRKKRPYQQIHHYG